MPQADEMPEWEKKLHDNAGIPAKSEEGEFNFSSPGVAGEAVVKRVVKRDKHMVEAAFGFINLCNNFQMPKTVSVVGEGYGQGPAPAEEGEDNLLPQPQQMAYNYACKFVTEYFKDGCTELPGHPEVPGHPQFNESWGLRSIGHDEGSGPEVGPEDVQGEGG